MDDIPDDVDNVWVYNTLRRRGGVILGRLFNALPIVQLAFSF